jgi:hypothetical protein
MPQKAVPSIPPEQLHLTSLLQAFHGIRSERLLNHELMGRVLEKLMAAPKAKPLLREEHFSVEGNLLLSWLLFWLQSWVSHASLERIDG